VARVREELEVLAGTEVGEVSAATRELPRTRIVVGTEAALHRYSPAEPFDAIAFLEFDQELLAPRVKASCEALSLLALASRLVRGREGRILVQTRLPLHPALRSAVMADPSLLLAEETELRRSLDLPPFAALAFVSGDGASDLAGSIGEARATGVDVVGGEGGKWLVRATSPQLLADTFADVPRPAKRVRVSIDPSRY
jgi:primosomal protein N' (replication factor Y)